MAPQPFLNNGSPFRCIQFVTQSGDVRECILLDSSCTDTTLAYMDYFNWVIHEVPFAELQVANPEHRGLHSYITVLPAEAGVPASVGAVKSARTGGIGRHVRFETIVHRANGKEATLLVLLENMDAAHFETIVAQTADIAFRDTGDARYCHIPSRGCMLTHITLLRSEKMRDVIARFAWAGLTAVCVNPAESRIMQYTPERLVRVAKTWNSVYAQDPINLAPKAEDMWTWHGAAPPTWTRQYFTFDGIGRQIANELLCKSDIVYIPYPIRKYVERELGLPSTFIATLTPRLSDEQMIQMNHSAYVREFAPYCDRRKYRTAAISWMYLLHGHIVRIMGTYKLTGRFRGLGERLRVFAGETRGARHIAPESMGRIVWNEGEMFGQKHPTNADQSMPRPSTSRRYVSDGATPSAYYEDPVARVCRRTKRYKR